MKVSKQLKDAFDELEKRNRSLPISNPQVEICVTGSFFIRRGSLDHIIERRGCDAKRIAFSMAAVLTDPSKISDNSQKRRSSVVFFRKIGRRIIRVITEETKTPGKSRVVSAYPISDKAYKKLVDISGRAHFSSI